MAKQFRARPFARSRAQERLMNITNAEQAAYQRANVDFKPLIDHFSALEYATKYATKQEKGSKAFEKMVALALNGSGRNEAAVQSKSAKGAFVRRCVSICGPLGHSAALCPHHLPELVACTCRRHNLEFSCRDVHL